MDRFTDLQALIAVAETGGISRAAERTSTTKSVISRRLSDLEKRLNVRLINRQPRGVTLTDAGRRFCERAMQVLADLSSAEEEAAGQRAAPQGIVRVTVPVGFGQRYLVAPFATFAAAHPRVTLDVDFDDRTVNVSAGGYDLAVRVGRLPDSSLVARVLAPMAQVLCASPAYLARCGAPQSPDDLKNHDAVLYGNVDPNPTWELAHAPALPTSYRVRARMRTNNGEMLLQFARHGLGIAAIPLFFAARSIAQRDLVVVLPDWAPPAVSIAAVYPSSRQLPSRVRMLIDHLVQAFEPVPAWHESSGSVRA
jgi:DNA-binding transcriptional LysR family regulator